MAWYALYKWFITFRKCPYVNWIEWYKDKLYHDWFESLSEEEKQAWMDKVEEHKRIKQERAEKTLHTLIRIERMLAHYTHGSYWDYLRIAQRLV